MTIWIIVVVAIVFVMLIVSYNQLVKLRNNREQAFADIDVQLKLRFDLVWNLVNTVKGYAKHESETFQKITEARTSFMNAGSADEKIWANNMLEWALKSLFAVSENYPDLKANENFLQLQNELSDIENKLAASRRFFNSATEEYNTYTEQFPSVIVANMFGFSRDNFFEVEDRASLQEAPKVEF